MHKLGEQWIEVIDGQEHMLKAVDSTYNCNGCAFLGDSGKCLHSSILECPVYRIDAIIKDLGIIKNGRLPCPWYKEVYPSVCEVGKDSWIAVVESYGIMMRATGNTKQQAIDAWNRRS